MRFWNLTQLESERGYGTPASWTAAKGHEDVVCPITRLHNMRRSWVEGELRVIYESSKVPDVIWPSLHDTFLVQDHVLERMQGEGLTGFTVRPAAEVTMPKLPGPPPRLWEVMITGWGGEAGDASGVRMIYYCIGCGHTRYSGTAHRELLIDPDRWDGSDLFRVWPLPMFVFASERVRTVFAAAKFRGYRMVPLEKFGAEMFTPGPPPPGREVRGPDAFPDVHIARQRWSPDSG
jgi:hypothetical protein